jgi:DNA polymerase III subunit alpha
MSHFIHLHCHTEFSLIDGLIRIKELTSTLQQENMPACAVTDVNNLFAVVQFYQQARKAGIKPIIGAEVLLPNDITNQNSSLILLCQDTQGYVHLNELISLAYTEGLHKGVALLHRDWLPGRTGGLLAISNGRLGDVGQALLAGKTELAAQYITFWQQLFPQRFYLAVQRTDRPQEEEYIHAVLPLAIQTNTPLVATNSVCFLRPEQFEAHEVRVCINQGYSLNDARRPREYSRQQYLRTTEDMLALFADIPQAIENTWYIAQRCNLELNLGTNYLPDFPTPAGMTVDEYFTALARQGLSQRFPTVPAEYTARLETELTVILQMGFAGYFLIVADFIQWAKNNDVPVGPGRGSGAGSLVAYALNITDLDPIKFDLLFERFLNPERVSMPDFDIDFCMEGRDRVIQYVAQKYGKQRVSQIITFGTLAAKAVVRDVGRVLSHPYTYVDKIAKLIPFELGMNLTKALQQEPQLKQLYQEEEEVKTLIDMGLQLEGLARNVGTHAGGVVISPTKLTDFCPLYWDGDVNNTVVTQLDKNDVESIGLVKFDFLGLRTLTIIKWALANIAHLGFKPPDMLQIGLDDIATFNLLKKAQTTAVFQLESRGLKELIKRLAPDCFEDIIALVALYRPGPLQSGMVDDFIDRKHGRAAIAYPHPDLQPILQPTYGVILYQEQVMQIAQVLAGYTLGGADLLRRAMGKKKPEEMAKQREIFTQGAVERGVKAETATYIFDLMEKFAGYGFNKSHSAAYALLSYQTAWLKTHYPAAFMAAVLSADMDNTDKVVALIQDSKELGLKIIAPHINHSYYRFSVQDKTTIVYGLGAIKGVGEAVVASIIEVRHSKYNDLFDFCNRNSNNKITRRILEILIKSGCFDNLGSNRASLIASLDAALKLAENYANEQNTGQNNLFAILSPSEKINPAQNYITEVAEWDLNQLLTYEKEYLGWYISGHPIEQYKNELKHLARSNIAQLRPNTDAKIAGLVTQLRTNNGRNGKMLIITIEDYTSSIDIRVYNELYVQLEQKLHPGSILIVEGKAREDNYTGGLSIIADQILTLAEARNRAARNLIMRISETQINSNFTPNLLSILANYRGGNCAVHIHYARSNAQIELHLGKNWRVNLHEDLFVELQNLIGNNTISINYNDIME